MHTFIDEDDGTEYKINKCPFCGMEVGEIIAQAELWDDEYPKDRWTVVCAKNRGGCGALCGFHGSKQKAVARWNVRFLM